MTLEDFNRDNYIILVINNSADNEHLEITSTAKNRFNDVAVDPFKK